MSALTQIVGAFLGAPAEQIAEYFKEKQRLKQELKLTKLKGQIAVEKAKEARAIQADNNDHEWEMLMIQNSGWKDEFVLLVVTIPFIMGFIPGMDTYALHGFAVLEKMPMWYQIMLVTIFFAIYGIRKWQAGSRRKLRLLQSITEDDKE